MANQAEPNSLRSAMWLRRHFLHEAPAGVTIDDVRKPEYWQHVLTTLKGGGLFTTVEVLGADGWECFLRVLPVDAGSEEPVSIRLLGTWGDYEAPLPPLPEGHSVERRYAEGWCLKWHGCTVAMGLSSAREAHELALDHAAALILPAPE